MATLKFEGLEEYERKLSALGKNSRETAAKAVYAGADIVANAIRNGLDEVPTLPNTSKTKKYTRGVPKIQIEGLKDSFGISRMRDDEGFLNVKIGFRGYNRVKTKKYPQGQPNQIIAAAVESGSSIQQKYPFVRKAIKKSQEEALEAMAAVIDEETAKIMK